MAVTKIRWDHMTGEKFLLRADGKWVRAQGYGGGRKRRQSKRAAASFYLMGDINEFQSPIDGETISSRSQLRAHERKHGVRQAGDFKPGELVACEKKRVDETRKIAQSGGVEFKWL